MKLFEYQAKELFESFQIPVPERCLIKDSAELDHAVTKVGLPCVIKAQVLHGGRGKRGLIQLAEKKEDAKKKNS
ncbi:ATP-grasp domain-containing protein [Virgibacillus halophilus]|uniref:ATP-grasp domain-containing protein n=1 Tax=Tigheibacillus halophilus TaxID=361280 RepID=A0ABU5C2V2_9BACI|nr:ATP-grasp domain-containing protein [Virgibacillus halophilus]